MKTLIMILMSISLGAGSAVLIQTFIIPAAPVVAVVNCPDPDTKLVEQVLTEKALEPLPVDDYVPQGRVLKGLRTGRE